LITLNVAADVAQIDQSVAPHFQLPATNNAPATAPQHHNASVDMPVIDAEPVDDLPAET
jgi:hypothetical protein